MKDAKIEYDLLLKSGMFGEFYPQLTCNWTTDKSEWIKIYRRMKRTQLKASI